ncbi:MAG: ABC transporter ATP-binding protein, partial [Moraxellaceae bacterium]|nr:ABC transporter ATP-binding protein [Moraxellaceae bacterium]
FMSVIAIAEVWLFSFLGDIVNWLSVQDRETFLQAQFWPLIGMVVVVVALPILVFVQSMLNHQTLMGNYPMRIRWLVHRYLLRQSMAFYQDEFAGRIATKLMQTALAVRECVIKLFDVLNYVIVYFLGTVVIIASADWRLAMPLLVWLICYVTMLRFFVPRMGRISKAQADARSTMTGRIVDSYTNIQTVKLFSHAQREASYAQEGMSQFMGTVYAQMRLVTKLNLTLYTLNSLLLLAVGGLAIWLWLGQALSVGAVAVAIGLVLRLSGMSQWIMWEVSSLFENIGTVQDGMGSISLPQVVEDQPNATALTVPNGEINFDQVRFHYGHESGVFEQLNLQIKAGEKVGLVGRSGA